MCKTIEIKYRCDRCGKTITKTRQTKSPIQYIGLWPRGYKRLHGRHVCTSCHNEFYTNTLKNYFNGGNKVAAD
jgi:ribosomal protein L44E